MLISDAYREQNQLLHTLRPDYGERGSKWAAVVLDIAKRHKCKSVLDYGCGKATLAQKIAPLSCLEYDPAIPEKSGEPAMADLVVCTDVLEHIEPDNLDDVLKHLQLLTRKRILFNICTQEAQKTLPNGINPHLIVENAEWWKQKISAYFMIDRWDIVKQGYSVTGEAVPLRPLGEIQTITVMSDARRNENVRKNCAAVSNRLQDLQPAHDKRAVLVCYGPSLQDTWPQVALSRLSDTVVTVSAAHKFLIERNVVPNIHIDCDPRQRKAVQFGRAHKQVNYWMASCVDPSYIKKLKGCDVSLWHIHNGSESEIALTIEENAWMLLGGGSVGLRAISLLYSQGYRKFSIHGMDSSFKEQVFHAGPHLGRYKKQISVWCHGRRFETAPALVAYAKQFMEEKQMFWADADFELHGDGLLQDMCRE